MRVLARARPMALEQVGMRWGEMFARDIRAGDGLQRGSAVELWAG